MTAETVAAPSACPSTAPAEAAAAPASSAGGSAAETSRKAVAEAGMCWYKVLGISILAPPDVIKQSFRKLALLHHPDKGGDAVTFKRVQEAYAEGMRKNKNRGPRKPTSETAAAKKAAAAAKGRVKKQTDSTPGPSAAEKAVQAAARSAKEAAAAAERAAVTAEQSMADARARRAAAAAAEKKTEVLGSNRGRKRPWQKTVDPAATKAKLKTAIGKWETSTDISQKTMPDEVPFIAPSQLHDWVRADTCLVVDARETSDGSTKEQNVAGALGMSYFQLTLEPERVAPMVGKLHADDRKVVIFSQNAERMGTCGMLGALLVDVFGLPQERVLRLDGGFAGWRRFVESNPQMLAEEALATAKGSEAATRSLHDSAHRRVEALQEAFDLFAEVRDGNREHDSCVELRIKGLAPQLEFCHLEECLQATWAYSLSKVPSNRGPFDELVISEIADRLERRKLALEVELELAAAKHAEATKSLREAQACLDPDGLLLDEEVAEEASEAEELEEEAAEVDEVVEEGVDARSTTIPEEPAATPVPAAEVDRDGSE